MTDALTGAIPQVPVEVLATIAREHFGLDGRVSVLGGERDLNALVATHDGRFTVKIANPGETDDVLALQIDALRHIASTDPALPVPHVVDGRSGWAVEAFEHQDMPYRAWVVTHLDGRPLAGGPMPLAAARSVGRMLARLQGALRGFFHPSAGRELLWDARRADALMAWTEAIDDPAIRQLASDSLATAVELARKLATLPAQVIHHDCHRGNLLVDPAADDVVAGIIDFGDVVHGARIQDLAVAAAYATLEHPDPLGVAAAVVAGFCEVAELEADEVELLGRLVGVRLAQSITISSHRALLHRANAEYITMDAVAVTAALRRWADLDVAEGTEALHAAAGSPVGAAPTAALVERRRASLWSGLRLLYDAPLHLVEGDGVWLVDARGRRYLDAYNNVVQVGHGNRRVIGAASAQARRLNTNTRYLTEPAIRLAEELVAKLPEPLEVCLLVNSGTEANDLAWRMARAVTCSAGGIVTEHAYHGWTTAIYALSPEERAADEAPDTVATMAAPGLPGPRVTAAIERLADHGHAPAAVWFDGTFSSDGIRVPERGYFRATAAPVRERGGLVVADEVQGGLGRVGRAYWSFAADETVPDIVTLGKPLGNGYAVGAVVTSRAIADRFAERGYFFSTFGGNPVSAAAARMVLRITDELELPSRADAVGALLEAELPTALAPLDGAHEIRRRGAFVGIELHAAARARAFVEALRDEGVLVGRTGPGGTVVKLRPPLVFDTVHAERLLDACAAVAVRRQ